MLAVKILQPKCLYEVRQFATCAGAAEKLAYLFRCSSRAHPLRGAPAQLTWQHGSQKQSVDQIVIKAVNDMIAQQGFVVPGDSEANQELHDWVSRWLCFTQAVGGS